MEYHDITWYILLLPLLVAAIILLFLRKAGNVAALLATGSVFVTLVLSFLVANHDKFPAMASVVKNAPAAEKKADSKDKGEANSAEKAEKKSTDKKGEAKERSVFPWINLGDDKNSKPILNLNIGLKTDKLSTGMMLVVTLVGFLVHLFSMGYMKDDEGKGRYFGALALFMFSMTGIVLADNFVMMFIFWELVGVSSYILISHWYHKASAADAAKKAFLTNRIGDFGFMLGILILWVLSGTIDFTELKATAFDAKNQFWLNMAVILIFCGAIGKSAQVPLHVWLPDAMEGPTPVSALIHAATMVAAGVFMLARISFLVVEAQVAASIIAWIGIITALIAALMALQQSDIKKILAYSTLSQLGYMVMAQGFDGGSGYGMFHLYTHAFFKALLFLGAGAVIYACHHEQNIWKMGGLMKKLPITGLTFAIGTAALIAVPLTSGFWSKEFILKTALNGTEVHYHKAIFWIAVFVAFLTPFYMARLFIVAFLGKARDKHSEKAHEVPAVMWVPLAILAALSLVSVYFGVPEIFNAQKYSIFGAPEFLKVKDNYPFKFDLVAICSMGALIGGVLLAFLCYKGKNSEPFNIGFLRDKFYIDELYAKIVKTFQDSIGSFLDATDKYFVDPIVARFPAMSALSAGQLLRLFQVGNLQSYVFYIGLAVLILLLLLIF